MNDSTTKSSLLPVQWLYLSRILLVLSLLVITYLAFAPKEFPTVSTGWDKANHLVAFYVLAFLLDFSYPNRPFSFAKSGFLLGYGCAIEIIQHFLPFREFSVLDFMTDGLGILFYLALIPLYKRTPLLKQRWTGQ